MSIFDKFGKSIGLVDGDDNENEKIKDFETRVTEAEEAPERSAPRHISSVRESAAETPTPGAPERPDYSSTRRRTTTVGGGASNVVDFHSAGREQAATQTMKVMVIEPQSFDDTQQIANCIRDKKPVVVNFENTDGEVAKRIVDFISGTTYALSGEIKKISRNVFLCAPQNVNVSYSQEQKSTFSDMPWMNGNK